MITPGSERVNIMQTDKIIDQDITDVMLLYISKLSLRYSHLNSVVVFTEHRNLPSC